MLRLEFNFGTVEVGVLRDDCVGVLMVDCVIKLCTLVRGMVGLLISNVSSVSAVILTISFGFLFQVSPQSTWCRLRLQECYHCASFWW